MNALGYGSIGLMNRIMKLYPSMFDEYHKLCGWFKDYKHQDELIGHMQAIKFPNSRNILCNAFSQRFFSDIKYEVDVIAWEKIIRMIVNQIKSNAKKTGILYEIHAPFKLGIGMKVDEIQLLKDVVDSYFNENDINFVYHF